MARAMASWPKSENGPLSVKSFWTSTAMSATVTVDQWSCQG